MVKKLFMSPNEFSPSFLSVEQDYLSILKKLFVESAPYSTELKKLLIVDSSDCMDKKYDKEVASYSLSDLKSQGYIRLLPIIYLEEFPVNKSYILISFDGFQMNEKNPEFRDCFIRIDIVCPTETCDLGNFKLRPFKIAGYIDGILNKARLSGIGKLQFVSCDRLLLDETLNGYSLTYKAIHGSDDKI